MRLLPYMCIWTRKSLLNVGHHDSDLPWLRSALCTVWVLLYITVSTVFSCFSLLSWKFHGLLSLFMHFCTVLFSSGSILHRIVKKTAEVLNIVVILYLQTSFRSGLCKLILCYALIIFFTVDVSDFILKYLFWRQTDRQINDNALYPIGVAHLLYNLDII